MIDWTFVLFAVVLPAIIGFLLGYHRRKPARPQAENDESEDQSCKPDDDRLWAENDSLFRPYVGEDVQGFHCGQTGPEEHSDGDPWSRDVDAFAAETRKALREQHPMPPRPAVVHEGNQEEYARWYEDQRRVQARFDEDFARIMAEKYPPMEHLS